MDIDQDEPVYVISVAAELAGMHAQTLRQYDRMGLVSPSRAPGRSRRYSHHDIETLRQIQNLSQDGVSLEGIRRILDLERQISAMRSMVQGLHSEIMTLRSAVGSNSRVFAAGARAGDVISLNLGERPGTERTITFGTRALGR